LSDGGINARRSMSQIFTGAIVGRLRAISFGFQCQEEVPRVIDGEVSASLFSPVGTKGSNGSDSLKGFDEPPERRSPDPVADSAEA
jgi:hypothetical protein